MSQTVSSTSASASTTGTSQTVSPSSIIPTSTTTSTTAQASSSAPPDFRFADIDEMYTCGVAEFQWTYSGPSAPMSFNITNANVAQQAPLGSSSATSTSETGSATHSVTQRDITMSKRQYYGYGGSYLPQINEQLATQMDPLVGVWRWPSANVPQGWYLILASVQGVLETSSSSFFVQNGTDVGCVLQFYPTFSTSVVVVSATTKATTLSSPIATTHTSTIAGGVIGGVAAVIAAIIIVAFARRCWRQDHVRRKINDPSFSSNAPIMRADAEVRVNSTLTNDIPSSPPHHQSGPVRTPIVPLNPGPSSSGTLLPLHSVHVPVGLSGKELAQLRSRGAALHPELTPASSPSDTLPTTTSPVIVVPTRQDEVMPPSEARITALQSEVEYLQREVLQLQVQQVRAEGFGAPPSYGEARSS